MDAVNEASTVADDGLSVGSRSASSIRQEEAPLVSILVPPSAVQIKIPLPVMSSIGNNVGKCQVSPRFIVEALIAYITHVPFCSFTSCIDVVPTLYQILNPLRILKPWRTPL